MHGADRDDGHAGDGAGDMVTLEEEGIGAQLRRIRERKGISQRRLALESGVDRAYISQIEAGGVRTITLRTARSLATGLGVRPEIFLALSAADEDIYLEPDQFAQFLDVVRVRQEADAAEGRSKTNKRRKTGSNGGR